MLRKLLFVGKINNDAIDIWQTNFSIIEQEDFTSAFEYLKKTYSVISAVVINTKASFSFLENIKNNLFLSVIPLFCLGEQDKQIYDLGVVDIIEDIEDESIVKKIMNIIKIREKAEMQGLGRKKNLSLLYKADAGTSFWDEKSLDSIILHSYVGAACIFEYFNGKIIVLRANNQYGKEIFGDEGNVEKALSMDLSRELASKDYKKVLDSIDEAIETKKQKTFEIVMPNSDSIFEEFCVKVTVKMIANAGERYLFFATILNFTRQHYAEVKRKIAEGEKEEADKMMKCITDNIKNGVSAISINGDEVEYIYFNDNFYKLFGYTKTQYNKELKNGFEDLIFKEDLEMFIKARVLHSPNVVFRVLKRDGELIWINSNTTSFYREDLDKWIFVSVLSDCTNEKKTEQRVNALNDKLMDSEVFFQLNLTTRTVEEFHTKFKSTIKFKAPFIYSDDYTNVVSNFIHEADREKVITSSSIEELKMRYLNGESKITLDFRKKTEDNNYLWYRGTAILMKGIDVDSVNAFVYCNDIDIEKKNDIAYENIINSEIETICIVNIKTRLAHLVKYNKESENIPLNTLFDYNSRIIRLINEEIALEDREKAKVYFNIDSMISSLENTTSVIRSFWEEKEGQPRRRKRMKASYLDDTHTDILLSGQDITSLFKEEQRQQDILQRAVDSANDANNAKTEFLSRMSHDMRTPLNAVMGMVGLAKEEVKDKNVLEYLENIEISSQFLLGLINDILDLSKIESRKIVLNEAPFNIDEFKRSIDTVIAPLMVAKNINFVFDVRNNPQIIMVDKLRFTQIFFNLLSNASKFTNVGGNVTFCVEHIPDKAGKYGMRFKVIDDGIGMSKSFLKVIFDPFVQERNTGVDQGSGLGLAITKNLVEAMGGNIGVESELGKGTTFTVDLYAYVQDTYCMPKEITDEEITRVLTGIRALIVDDKEINLYLIEKILEDRGCSVSMANNGKEAVEIFKRAKEGSFDIILTDIRMPIMDGFEEAKAIRGMNRKDAQKIPIIAVTADLYDDEKVMGDISAYIPKPFNKTIVYKTVYEVLMNTKNNNLASNKGAVVLK